MTVTNGYQRPALDYDKMADVLAGTLADYGFIFVEDPMVPALAASLRAFTAATGLPVNPPNEDD
ncbi:hypothetical protein [Actinoplanes sp. HUAS TT8]|uniref:hypothetical protein n=1 Tax=Actinoplanes sp. HUAS TT8 TaxID=3447453 RepID=UPI003F522ADC